MEPELIVEAEKVGFLTIRFLDSTKHLVVHLQFLPAGARRRLRLRRSTTNTLVFFLDYHYQEDHQINGTRRKRNDFLSFYTVRVWSTKDKTKRSRRIVEDRAWFLVKIFGSNGEGKDSSEIPFFFGLALSLALSLSHSSIRSCPRQQPVQRGADSATILNSSYWIKKWKNIDTAIRSCKPVAVLPSPLHPKPFTFLQSILSKNIVRNVSKASTVQNSIRGKFILYVEIYWHNKEENMSFWPLELHQATFQPSWSCSADSLCDEAERRKEDGS